MQKPITLIFLIIISISLTNCKTNKTMIDNSTVKALDLERYLGTWYEIARFPHSFEKDLVGVKATYSLKENGKIKVVNQGYKNTLDGKLKTATGKAYIPDPNDSAKLKVSFFWFFYGDYFVMELDEENYQWAVIGSNSPGFLWILSRSPQMEQSLYEDLITRIKNRGYNLERLEKVPQKG
jgi:lipocalin